MNRFCEGDKVRMRGQEAIGEILKKAGDKVEVGYGAIKLIATLSQLTKVVGKVIEEGHSTKRQAASRSYLTYDTYISFNPSIDLHGLCLQESLNSLDKFMDKAILLGHTRLSIIHGKGEGVLRKAVRTYLQSHKQVKQVLDKHPYKGGDGVTFVELK